MGDAKEIYWHCRFEIQSEKVKRTKREIALKTALIERQIYESLQDKSIISELRLALSHYSEAQPLGFRLLSEQPSSDRELWRSRHEVASFSRKPSTDSPSKTAKLDLESINRESFSLESSEDRLFEEFFLVGIRQKWGEEEGIEPRILVQFPGLAFTENRAKSEADRRTVLPKFCFPTRTSATDISKMNDKDAVRAFLADDFQPDPAKDEFIFTVKSDSEEFAPSPDFDRPNKDRSHIYGVTLRFSDLLVIGKDVWKVPRTYVLLSYQACFALHFQILIEMRKAAMERLRRVALTQGLELAPRFKRAIRKTPIFEFPEMRILVDYWKCTGSRLGQELALFPETSSPFQTAKLSTQDTLWCTSQLLRSLTPSELWTVFAALANERSLVFVSESLGLLSACVLGVLPLLRPFTWQHILLPVLPHEYVEMLDAPTPIIVGFPSKIVREKAVQNPVLWVLLDEPRGHLLCCPSFLRELTFPSVQSLRHCVEPLHAELQSLGKSRQASDGKVQRLTLAITREFANFWESVIRCMPLEVPLSPQGDYIDVEELADVIVQFFPEPDCAFLRCFLKTQMFVAHLEDRKLF